MYPLIRTGWLGWAQLDALLQAIQFGSQFAGHLCECVAFHIQIIQGSDFLRLRQVEAGLSFIGIRDGGGADFKITFCRFELFADR